MIIRTKIVNKTRKDYECFKCKKTIPTGSSCKVHTVVNGKLETRRECIKCKSGNLQLTFILSGLCLLLYWLVTQ
jgi:hypothetical protein